MFEDSLLESGGRLKTKRGRTTTFAIILEIGLIGIMVLMPLIFTSTLAQFTVGAFGTSLTYQWQRAVVGGTAFSNVTDANASGATTAQ